MYEPRQAIHIKVCGVRRPEDAERILKLGASYVGFIHHPASPRFISEDAIRELCGVVPREKRVLVTVEPEPGQLRELSSIGFAAFQVHAKDLTNREKMLEWAAAIRPAKLWIAPRLPPDSPFPEHLLDVTDTWLIDTYSPKQTGGTGKTGNWPAFRKWKESHPDHRFILAGGITPSNILEAAAVSHANWIDVSSGVEASPGIKDPEKLKALFARVRGLEG